MTKVLRLLHHHHHHHHHQQTVASLTDNMMMNTRELTDGSSDHSRSPSIADQNSSTVSMFSHQLRSDPASATTAAASSSSSSSSSLNAPSVQQDTQELAQTCSSDEDGFNAQNSKPCTQSTSDEDGFNGCSAQNSKACAQSTRVLIPPKTTNSFQSRKNTSARFARQDSSDFSGMSWAEAEEAGEGDLKPMSSSGGTQDKRVMMLPFRPLFSKTDLSVEHYPPNFQCSSERNVPCFQRSSSCKLQDSMLNKPISKNDVLKMDISNLQACFSKGFHMNADENLKRCGSQGPASQVSTHRPTLPSPGSTPSRSSFSGIHASYMSHRANYLMGKINMINGKASQGYKGMLSDYEDSIRSSGVHLRALPSKWENAEKWLVYASPSHPQGRCRSPSVASSKGGSEGRKSTSHKHQAKPMTAETMDSLSSSCDHFHSAATTMSDSEVSNTYDEECKVFVRSSSQKHKEGSVKPKGAGRRTAKKRESPALLQLEQLKPSCSHQNQTNDAPKVQDIYADRVVEALTHKTLCHPPDCSSNRLVVQAPKNNWLSPMKDVATEISPKVSRNDLGAHVNVQVGGSRTSKPTTSTPQTSHSPMRHNTPTKRSSSWNCINQGSKMLELDSCHLAKLEHRDLKSIETKEHPLADEHLPQTQPVAVCHDATDVGIDVSVWIKRQQDDQPDGYNLCKSSRPSNFDATEATSNALDQTSAFTVWEEAERTKHMAKYACEEARINAWENHQKAKAEAELKKLEMKLEKLRAQATEKILTKIAAAHRRAEEMRAIAQAQQAEQLAKSLDRAAHIRKSAYFPESLGVCFSKLS